MAIDWDKVDEVTMALLKLTSFTEHGITRSWKGHNWDVMNRLYEKGWIQDPVGKAKSLDEPGRQDPSAEADADRLRPLATQA